MSILAFATKGKTQMGEGSEKSCKWILQMKCRMAQIRRRSSRHREELGETAKGCPRGLSEAAAR